MTEDELDAVYVEAIGPAELADEQWDREWAAIHNDPDLRDAAEGFTY